MNKEFLLKENSMKKNLLQELRYALPTVKLLEIVNTAFFELPNGQMLILKNRSGEPLKKSNSVAFYNYNATEEEIQSLSRKVVEIKFSGFNKRGQNAILDYMAATHREQMKEVLKENVSQKEDKPKVEEKQKDPFFGGKIFGEQSPEDFLQKALNLKMGPQFIATHQMGSGKTAHLMELAKQIPSLLSTLSEDVLANSVEDLFAKKEEEETELNSEEISKSSSLYLDCNMLAELSNGQVKFIKSRDEVKNLSPEMEFLVLTDLSQLEFYPKGFFKGKNILIVK